MFWNSGWHSGTMWLGWVLLIVAVVAVSWILASYARRDGRENGESVEQTLKRRYARGEIGRETYEHMLADLRK